MRGIDSRRVDSFPALLASVHADVLQFGIGHRSEFRHGSPNVWNNGCPITIAKPKVKTVQYL